MHNTLTLIAFCDLLKTDIDVERVPSQFADPFIGACVD